MTTKSNRKLSKHILAKHNISMNDYTREYGRTMEHIEKHTCQVKDCGSTFWWTATSFSSHLNKKHNLPIDEYEKEYMADYIESSTNVCKSLDQNNVQDRYSECKFSCNICKPGKLFYGREKTGRHMKAVHKTNLIQYKEKYGSSLSYKINQVCQICAAVLLWDKSSIRKHLYSVHENLPVEEYFNKYIDNFAVQSEWLNMISFTCGECAKEDVFFTKSRHEFWEHVKDKHSKSEEQYRSVNGSMYGPDLPKYHTCQICFIKLNWEALSLKPHIELKHDITIEEYEKKYKDSYSEEKTTNPVPAEQKSDNESSDILEWTAGCLYKCNNCGKQVEGLYQFKKHLMALHSIEYRQYERMYDQKDFLVFSGFHICLFCQKNVRHDYQCLKSHMRDHGLSLAQYMDKYKPKPPKLSNLVKTSDQVMKKELLDV